MYIPRFLTTLSFEATAAPTTVPTRKLSAIGSCSRYLWHLFEARSTVYIIRRYIVEIQYCTGIAFENWKQRNYRGYGWSGLVDFSNNQSVIAVIIHGGEQNDWLEALGRCKETRVQNTLKRLRRKYPTPANIPPTWPTVSVVPL